MWEGEIRAVAKNTHSYYMLSHPIRESLLYYSFNFSYERGYLKFEIIFVNSLDEGLLDSAKTVRAALWNSLTIVSTIITSD